MTTAVNPDVAGMRDWTEVLIRPVFEVSCPVHGLLGHTVRADEARLLQRRHWDAEHAGTRPGAGA